MTFKIVPTGSTADDQRPEVHYTNIILVLSAAEQSKNLTLPLARISLAANDNRQANWVSEPVYFDLN